MRRLLLLFTFAAAVALAQDPDSRAGQIVQQRDATFRTPLAPDTDPVERGVLWMKKHHLLDVFSAGWHGVTPIVGGMVNGSGLSGGLQFLRQDLAHGQVIARASARISTRGYQLLDAEIGAPTLANNRFFLDLYARHRNYSQLAYFGPGPNSQRWGRTDYRLEDTSADLTFGALPFKWMRVGATGGYLTTNVGPTTSTGHTSTERVYTPAQTPGIDRQTDFFRGGGFVQIDTRDNPYGPRAGGQYYARYDYYTDNTFSAYSFRRLTAEVQEFVPFANRKRVLAMRAKTILSYPQPGNRVPFYLQPSLGSADDLRGFRSFRFYDDNTFAMTGEWRWELNSATEAALFVDGGKVFRRPGLINFKDLEGSYGVGLRFRSNVRAPIVSRVDLAFSREGFQLWFVFNDLFAVPQLRTGRELSPPPGRLP